MRYLILAIMILFGFDCQASQITIPVIWSTGDTVTDAKLNIINNTFANVINGGLDNTNMASGYRMITSVGSLPAAGNQGNVSFLTSDNSLNIDNGASWQKTITPNGTPQTGSIAYYNSGWQLLNPGTAGYPLVSQGTSSLPTYASMTTVNTVSGATLFGLSSISASAGPIPAANLPGFVPRIYNHISFLLFL